MTKKVAKKTGNAVVSGDDRPDWMTGSDRGNEDVSTADLVIPRLDVLQDLSPQIKKTKPEYIEGAEAGMLFNTVTGELYGNVLMFVPVYYRKEWVIWKDINSGGGFRGSHGTEHLAKEALSQLEDKDQCEIVDTGQQFGLIVDSEGSAQEVCISMAKSKAKVSRQLNSMIRLRGGDRFSSVYEIRAVEDQNSAGQDYYNMSVKPLGYVSKEVYERAEALYDSIKAGAADVSRDPDKPQEEGEREF